jgi:Na+-driven multidrug efflux pump
MAIDELDDVSTPAPPAPAPELERRVLGMAWPVIGENLLQTLLGVVDTLLVAQLGAAAIAGVGAGTQLTFFLISVVAGVTIGASILVAHATGAGDAAGARRLAKQALVWSVVLSVPVSILSVLLADPLVAVFGLEPAVAQIGADYWRVVSGGSLFLILMLTAGAVLRSVGDSRSPMLATLLANVINAVAAYGLIFGAFGLPELGAVGSAWAATLGRVVGAIALLAVLWYGRRLPAGRPGGPHRAPAPAAVETAGPNADLVQIRGDDGWRPELTVARRIFNLGVPASLEQVLITLSFVALTAVIASLGTNALAAQRLTFTALSLAFLPGFGFAIAATALVGQSLGARRPAEAAAVAGIATRWSVIWMGALGFIYVLFGEPIMRLFSADPTVIAFGVQSFWVLALALPFWAIMFVQSGALRGVGNTSFPLRVNAVGMWAAVGGAALGVGPLGLGLIGGWGAYTVMAPLLALVLWRRFRRGDWQTASLAGPAFAPPRSE